MKTLTMKERVTALLLAGTLAVGGAMAALEAPPAYAATGSVTIEAATGNEGATYNAWQIFQPTTLTGGSQGIDWTSAAMRTAVVAAIQAEDSNYEDGSTSESSANKAAQFIATHISAGDENNATSFANALAAAVNSVTGATTLTAGTAANLNEGWWLVTAKTGNTGTSPIFLPVTETGATVNEKTSVPTLTKEVKEDSTNEYGSYANASLGEELDFKLTATLPSNLSAYSTYSLTFTDTPSGLDFTGTDDVAVTLGGNDVTNSFDISIANGVLTASCSDLIALGANASDTVVLTYKAAINDSAVMGSAGNSNEATITYSNNPFSNTTATSEPSTNEVETYQVQIFKKDATDSNTFLADAKFTLADANGNLIENTNAAPGANGYEFVSDDMGKITIPRLDAGLYTLNEVAPPEGYTGSVEYDFTIEADPENNTIALDAQSISGAQALGIETNVAAGTGTIELSVPNAPNVPEMPLTGQQGIMLITAAGLVLVGGSAVMIRRNRKEANE